MNFIRDKIDLNQTFQKWFNEQKFSASEPITIAAREIFVTGKISFGNRNVKIFADKINGTKGEIFCSSNTSGQKGADITLICQEMGSLKVTSKAGDGASGKHGKNGKNGTPGRPGKADMPDGGIMFSGRKERWKYIL